MVTAAKMFHIKKIRCIFAVRSVYELALLLPSTYFRYIINSLIIFI
jgi:hypothetical protein